MGAGPLPQSDRAASGPLNGGPGILAALSAEARCISAQAPPAGGLLQLKDGLLAVAGVGQDAAERAAQRLCDAGAPALVSFGTAGGLDPRLASGCVLLPRQVIDGNGETYAVDAAWQQRLVQRLTGAVSIDEGVLYSARDVSITAAHKRATHLRWQAVAVDMETAAVAQVARRHRIPFVVIRVVIDTAADSLPRAALVGIDGRGRLRPGPLAGALLGRPQEWGDLWRLSRQFRLAQAALKRVRVCSAPGLAWMGNEADA